MKPRSLAALLAFFLLGLVAGIASPETWTKEIAALTADDAAHPPPHNAVVFVGSSSIRLWKTVAEDFPGIATIRRGFGGSELADSVFYLDRIVLPYQPRIVVLFAGTNDLWAGKSPEAVAADFTAFRTKLHAALPGTKLIYLSITLAPSRARIHEQMRTANQLIAKECASDPHCQFVDINGPMTGHRGGTPPPELFIADQLHLNQDGYAIWTKVLAPYLR
ncbi:MAG TPA: GDSL-type esterase/lipase family protein [Lacunisphaera sp.]|nr:GDSL-type esterase/lipase family protein [Lacunisphaera sp.]